jgi:hypothetical protein
MNGRFRDKQKYKCKKCGTQFQNKGRKEKLQLIIWKKYVWERRTLNQLVNDYGKSKRWVQNQLDQVVPKSKSIHPQPVVIGVDCVFFGRTNEYIVFRSPKLKRNIYWKKINQECAKVYSDGRRELEDKGFIIQAATIDGKHGNKGVFSDVPTQMCHFHQSQIVFRYLTKKPKLKAAKELNKLTSQLTKTDKASFTILLNKWNKKWEHILQEKTVSTKTGKSYFIHKKLRSAYRSLKSNLPYLFTYEDYPELNIPNTN